MSGFNHECEIEIEIDNDHLLMVVVSGTYFVDHNYGADADGNRGTSMVECDDFVITDQRGNDITDKLDKKFPKVFEKISQTHLELSESAAVDESVAYAERDL